MGGSSGGGKKRGKRINTERAPGPFSLSLSLSLSYLVGFIDLLLEAGESHDDDAGGIVRVSLAADDFLQQEIMRLQKK